MSPEPHQTVIGRAMWGCVEQAGILQWIRCRSSQQQALPTPKPNSALPSPVDLNSNSTAIHSSRSSSRFKPATITGQDLPVFTTDSQSPWLPSTSPNSLPATSAQQSPQQFSVDQQQDFVLFDQPSPARAHNRSRSQQSLISPLPLSGSHSPATSNCQSRAAASLANLGTPVNSHNHSGSSAHSPSQPPLVQPHTQQHQKQHQHQLLHLQQQQQQGLHLVPQNQRVAQIIQATGHKTTSTTFTNRLNNNSSSLQPQQNHQQRFYASSAPSSTVALDQLQKQPQLSQQRIQRPPVPLFSQITGNMSQAPANMPAPFDDLSLDELASFDGASATSYSSPAVPVFDINTSGTSTMTSMDTVSPKDLLITASAPNSTALTNLTSPSLYNGSPEYDNFETSPAFHASSDFSGGDPVDWFPLFPQSDMPPPAAAPTPQPQHQHQHQTQHQTQHQPQPHPQEPIDVVDHSPAEQSDDIDDIGSPAPSSGRRKSGNSPPGRSHSSVAGVNSRRRDKPLPPIIVDDPSNVVAMKRARNTLAARKSRQRKAERLEILEGEIEKLKQERDHWKNMAMAKMG